jgi:hypothetical protein
MLRVLDHHENVSLLVDDRLTSAVLAPVLRRSRSPACNAA